MRRLGPLAWLTLGLVAGFAVYLIALHRIVDRLLSLLITILGGSP